MPSELLPMNPVPINTIMRILRREATHYAMPVADWVHLQTNDPFKVLVAALLSARTKDDLTARILPRLFHRISTPEDIRRHSRKEIEQLIFPIGFYRMKAAYLKQLPEILDREFNGKIPEKVEELTTLPGVGRKTANLVRAVAFKKEAIAVDVHVHRIMNRLGYVTTHTPHETETALRKKLPRPYWRTVNRLFVAFGQNICRPVSPKCSTCPIYRYCHRVGVTTRR
jgi:endonuclease III